MHSGKWSRKSAIKDSNRVALYISQRCEEEGIHSCYDMSYDGSPHELMYTEIFGGAGCIMIRPQESKFWNFMLDRVVSSINDQRILMLRNAGDKYNVCHYPYKPHKVKRVCFLPGSNLLHNVPKGRVKELADKGVFIKPHPITTAIDLQHLFLDFGSQFVYPNESGWDLMKAAEKIYCTGSTELGLYATLFDKQVSVIHYDDKNKHKEVYAGFYNHLDKLKVLVSTPLSGIIFNDDTYKEQVDIYLTFYRENYEYAKKNFLIMHKSWNV